MLALRMNAVRGTIVWLVVTAFIQSCGGTATRASEAYDRGDYLRAAKLYDELVAANPRDRDALEMRSRARQRALAELCAKARAARDRRRTEVYFDRLTSLLVYRDGWNEPADDCSEQEMAAGGGLLRAHIAGLTKARRPLAAEASMRRRAALLARDRKLHNELARMVTAAGSAQCARVKPLAGPEAPYLTLLIARYCQHFRQDLQASFALPDLRSAPAFEGLVTGATSAQMDELRRRLTGIFAQSIWHSPSATVPARITFEGSVAVTFAKERVSRRVPWIERVPYTTTETVQVPHQVSYTATESYMESVPVTRMESYTYSCGMGRTCNGSRSVTHYESRTRTRPVTRFRTEYRSQTRTVTRYRDVPRVFELEADEHVGAYQVNIRLDVDVRGPSPVVVALARTDEQRGLEHNVTFAPAKVAPARPNLPLAEEWFEAQLESLTRQLRERLQRHWIERFCGRSIASSEQAARCAYVGKRLPPIAVRKLAGAFGDEAGVLLEGLAHPSL